VSLLATQYHGKKAYEEYDDRKPAPTEEDNHAQIINTIRQMEPEQIVKAILRNAR